MVGTSAKQLSTASFRLCQMPQRLLEGGVVQTATCVINYLGADGWWSATSLTVVGVNNVQSPNSRKLCPA